MGELESALWICENGVCISITLIISYLTLKIYQTFH
jgi:hypothetical protein